MPQEYWRLGSSNSTLGLWKMFCKYRWVLEWFFADDTFVYDLLVLQDVVLANGDLRIRENLILTTIVMNGTTADITFMYWQEGF